VVYKITSAIVIGGGIAGCSTAYSLAARGIAVTLIERHNKFAQEASGNPVAMLYPKLSAKPSKQSALALQGFAFTLNLLRNLPNHADFFDACGQIQLAFDARETARQQQISQQNNVQFLSVTQASEIAGISLSLGGLYLPQAGWVRPEALCNALASLPLITTIIATNALKIEKKSNGWQVLLEQNKAFEANIVVICNANDILQFSQCRQNNIASKITPVRGQINFFAQNNFSQNIKTIICSDHSLSPAVAGLHTIGTSYAPNEANPNLSDADTLQNLNALRKISPELYASLQASSISGRVAWRSSTLDYMPLAGQLLDDTKLRKSPPRYNANPESLSWLNGLYVNAGHGSKGMISAPLCGELIACLASNSALPLDAKLASSLNPSRFLLKELGLKQLAASLY
jgi:tRNA 5-methylaminomethyl-2-thiouridine biosynthesis bifunctional protein